MNRRIQLQLIDELVDLHARKTPFLDESWETIDTGRYQSPEIFARERARIHHRLPQIAAHASALPEPGTFRTTNLGGVSLLLTRDASGAVRAFHNVCRHRGAELVAEASGCRHRFSCPYHAWTYDNTGRLIGLPHEKSGFPDLDRGAHGLHRVACSEFAGWIWVRLSAGEAEIDVAAHLGDMAADIVALEAGGHVVFQTDTLQIAANWKILVEGGLEAYHFRVAHRNTIAPLFLDNLSSYQCFGPHTRSVLPRSTLPGLKEQPQSDWSLREHANILYSLFPGSQFLVQEDHFVWIQGMPLAPDRTRLVLSSMIPGQAHTPERQDYWTRNHQLTLVTLQEDFALAEGIQRGLASGANRALNFGRFEGALAAFNRSVDDAIG